MSIDYLDPATAEFKPTPGGFLSLKVPGRRRFKRVHLYRMFPTSQPDGFISVRDEKEQEIGVIDSLAGYPAKTVSLLREDLDRRYYSPVITRLVSLKEEFGYTYWDAETQAGMCRFTVKGGENNAYQIGNGTLLIIDVDGNRFTLPDFEQVEAKHLKIIDTML